MNDVAEDPSRPEQLVPEVEVERTSVQDSPPPVTPPTAPAAPETDGPSSTTQQPPEHVPVSYRELSAVMDAVCALATTQASLDERMAGVEVTLVQNNAMLLRIMSHLGLPPVSMTEPTQPTTRDQSAVSVALTSLDMLAQLHLLLPQLLRRSMAHPPQHSSHQSMSLLVLGSYLLLWMLSAHLLLLRRR